MQDLIRAIASGMRSQAIRYLARNSKNSGFSELKYLLTGKKKRKEDFKHFQLQNRLGKNSSFIHK